MIRYFNQDIKFDFRSKRLNSSWLSSVASSEGKKIGDICVVFCSDEYILKTNVQFLSHEYYTDIITFDYCEGDILSGDLIISIDSVRDNAQHYGSNFDEELHRVIVHGLLHLIGFDDHKPEDIVVMRSKENQYLDLRKKILESV